MIEAVAVAIRRDVGSEQESLSVAKLDEGVSQLDLPRSNCFDLGAGEHDPGLQPFEDLVVVTRLAVDREVAMKALSFAAHEYSVDSSEDVPSTDRAPLDA